MRRLLLMAVILLAAIMCQAEWAKGLVHIHQKSLDFRDDGFASQEDIITKAKQLGYQFVVTTPHYHQGKNRTKPSQAENRIILIDGNEMATYWGGDLISHLLVLGDFYGDQEVDKFANHYNTQQLLINRLNELGHVVVAAHPNLIAIVNQDLAKGDPAKFLFNFSEAKGLGGIEFFNDKDAYGRTRSNYLDAIFRGQNLIVTGGCDSHNLVLDLKNKTRWTRSTWVWVDGELTKEKIIDAFRHGRTYASQYGISLSGLAYMMGFEFQKVARPQFEFNISFNKNITTSKSLRLYRDNQIVKEWQLVHGDERCGVFWEDIEVGRGNHIYIIEIENCLITSPIKLSVVSAPENEATKTLFQKLEFRVYTGSNAVEDLGSVSANWSKTGEDPVPNSQSHFRSPVYLEILVVFKNKDQPHEKIWTTQDLKWSLWIYNENGQLKMPYDLGGGIGGMQGGTAGGGWKTCWTTRVAYFDQPGRYRLKLENRQKQLITEEVLEIE